MRTRVHIEAILTVALASSMAVAAPAEPAAAPRSAGMAASVAAAQPNQAPRKEHVSMLTAEQLLQILDETVDWYRTLGTQQQSATQPSDLLLFYANRQLADKVINLAFGIARANAELLSSEAASAGPAGATPGSSGQLEQFERNTAQRVEAVEEEMASVRRELASAPARSRSGLNAKLSELQGELAMVKAQKNLFDNMSQFVFENDPQRAGAIALKARIDALASTIPAASSTAAPGSTPAATTPTPSAGNAAATSPATRTTDSTQASSTGATAASPGLGIWDLVEHAYRLSEKLRTIDAVDQRTRALGDVFLKIRSAPNEQLHNLSARSDALAKAADSANGATLKSLRDQFDTLAWLFMQTAAIAIPLNQENVLLTQYRQNLDSWRAEIKRQDRDVLRMLATRLALLAAVLLLVFAASEVARRTIVKYVHEVRYRNQLLLLRRLVTWIVVLLVLSLTFITHLSSFATFAGLLTAGLAVAMQSVLVSVVGYFILIGKYGVRVGDRVQIGDVYGEIIDIGLIRMHLLELAAKGPLGPTGRVVAFANSIVFQASGGLFRQIPGVNFAWHELTLSLPRGSDYVALKDQLVGALTAIVESHRGEIVRQAETIRRTTSSSAAADIAPQVQLQFSAAGVDAKVRYPVPLNRMVEVDERVSKALHEIVQRAPVTGTPGSPDGISAPR
jgi:small-conductance mechanosensitive channel